MLRKEDYVNDAPASPGQVHINHIGCPAGTDTRKRLYIRRTDDGCTILAHCHNCGESGFVFETGIRSLSTIKSIAHGSHSNTSNTSRNPGTLALPRDFEGDPRGWSIQGRSWVYQYGITDAEIKKYGIGYSANSGRVILPAWEDGVLVGYQERRVLPNDTGPKYLTHWKEKGYVWKDLTISKDTVVLCEDILSGIKLARHVSSVALIGTHLNRNHYAKILEYKHIKIFLDNDNADVKMKAVKLKNDLSLYVPNVSIISIEKNPKACTNKELIELCDSSKKVIS